MGSLEFCFGYLKLVLRKEASVLGHLKYIPVLGCLCFQSLILLESNLNHGIRCHVEGSTGLFASCIAK